MIRYKSSRQLSISEFKMPFEAKQDENNGWVVLQKNSTQGRVCPALLQELQKATVVHPRMMPDFCLE